MSDVRQADRDRGAILILTLVLCVALAVVAVALLQFAATGLRTSRVSTDRTERAAASTAGIYFVMEELSVSDPLACSPTFVVPPVATPGDVGVTVSCSQLTTAESPVRYELIARTADGHPAGDISVEVEVRSEMAVPRSTRIVSWTSDS